MTSLKEQASRSRLDLPRGLFRLAPFFTGMLAGTIPFVWVHQYLTSFGVSLPVVAALSVTLAIGVAAVPWIDTRLPGSLAGLSRRTLAWLALAVWTVGFPWFLSAARWSIRLIPASWLETEATAFCALLAVAMSLFAVPVSAMGVLGTHSPDGNRRARDVPFFLSTQFLVGCGMGLGTAPVLLASWLSVEQIRLVLCGLTVLFFWISLFLDGPAHGSPPEEKSANASAFAGRVPLIWVAAISCLSGLQIAVLERLVVQYMPGSGFLHFAFWAGLLCGIGCGLLWADRLRRQRNQSVSRDGVIVAGLITAAWPAVLLALCPLLLQGTLFLNARVSHVPLLIGIRWLMAFGVVLPIGAALGRAWSHPPDGIPVQGLRLYASQQVGVLCFAAGFVLMKCWWVSSSIALPLLSFSAVCVVAARLWVSEGIVLNRRHWAGGMLAAAAVACLPVLRNNYRPDLAAKLLFSTQAFAAHNAGINGELLPHLDDGRLVSVSDGRDAVWTVWKHRGSQMLLRRDGIPQGIVSTNPAVCPQFAGDIMPAVVPLVVHRQPESVLLVGLGSTAALSTCLACPVRHVTCIEADDELVRLNDRVIAEAAGFNPLADDRVELQQIDPTLALLAAGNRYDVVILGNSHPFLLRESSRFTREFYTCVDRRLREGGIVCQRLKYADFGREPIEDALATLRSVFAQVACLESAPGEMLLLASNSEQPLVDESLLKRCEAAHIRRLLAQLGWDWSVILNLAAISPEQIDELSARNVTVNTIGNGAFTYRLPQEVMRWGPKWQEIRDLLGERGSRMLAWVGDSDEVNEVTKRLADMTEQHRLIVEHPDRFWAYRKTLKERLKERPRTEIVQVNHELQRGLHPEDQRRKEYLEALSVAATSQQPDPADIARIAEYAEPYDPLVSYFLHQEAARLYERVQPDQQAARFDHLRYSVHFGPQQDRSVRNVVAALQLLLQDPKLIPDPARRWDELNALLDILRVRSMLRMQTDNTPSPFELNDAETSIHIAERAMDAMDELCADANVAGSDWKDRRTVLQRMLIRPMWAYHSQQAKKLAAIDAQRKQTADAPADDEETTTR